MKEKIIAALKAKFPAINLSKSRLEAIADRIEPKVGDDEAKIDAQLDAFNEWNPIADIAKNDDTVRDLKAKLKNAAPAPKDKDKTDPAEPALPDDTPAWAKALIEQNKTLSQDIAVMKGEKIRTKVQAIAAEKLKDVPEIIWSKRPIPEKEDELDAFVAEVKADYSAYQKDATEKGLSVLGPAKAGQQQQAGVKGIPAAVKQAFDKQAGNGQAQQAQPPAGKANYINTPAPI